MSKQYIRRSCLVLGRLLPLLLLSLLGSDLLAQIPSIDGFNQTWIDNHTRENGWHGIFSFMLVSSLLASVGVPRQIIAFLGGYAFGFAEGVIYSTLAISLSCLFTMSLSRLYAKPIVMRLFSNKVTLIDKFLTKQVFVKTIIIRLLPIGNNLMTNISAGVTAIKIWPFVLGSLIGYFPQMAVFALMGKGVVMQSYWKITLSVIFLGLSSILSLYLYKRFKADKYLADSLAVANDAIGNSGQFTPSSGHK